MDFLHFHLRLYNTQLENSFRIVLTWQVAKHELSVNGISESGRNVIQQVDMSEFLKSLCLIELNNYR